MIARTTRIGGLVLCIALVASMVTAPVAAHGEQQAEFLVDLDTSGDATVSVTLTYDLHSEEEREAFRELQENSTAQEEHAERFENRMTAVAEDASNATGRDMAVTDASVEVVETEDVGLLTLEVAWTNLAAVDGDRLTLTEPFASGFEPEMAFVVAIPQGYERVSTTPEPSSSTTETATWDADVDLQDFELVAEPSPDDEESPADETEDDGAGFGVVVALVALFGVALLASRSESVAE